MSDQIEIRAASAAPTIAEDAQRPRLTGHFARFNSFNEIDSVAEGRFLERIMPGAFKKTLAEQGSRIRMMFQHGRDPYIGDKPIGSPDVLREDAFGPYFEGDLFDSVPPLVVDGLRAGQYGISYRFSVMDEEWDHTPKRTDINPRGLPERTIKQARVYEFGPVTFPADPGADYAVRSLTLADIDATFAPRDQDPALPDDAEAVPHDDGSREAVIPEPPPAAAPIAHDPPEGGSSDSRRTPVTEYVTRDEKAARVTEIEAELVRMAQEHSGVMSDGEQARWDELRDERLALGRDIEAADERARIVKEIAERSRPAESPAYSRPNLILDRGNDPHDIASVVSRGLSPEKMHETFRDNAMRIVERATFPDPQVVPDKAREHMQWLLDNRDTTIDRPGDRGPSELARRIAVSTLPAYVRGFAKVMAYGSAASLSPEEQRGTALAVQVDGTGGFLAPATLDPTILGIGAWTAVNPYRAACRVESLVGTDTWLGLTSTAVVATRAAEAAAATEQGPTIAQPSAVVSKVQGQITYSIEMGNDVPNLLAELARGIAEAKDTEEESKFTTGDGAALGNGVQPIGMIPAKGTSGAFTGMSMAGAHAYAIADVRSVYATLPVRYRRNGAWFMNGLTIQSTKGLETVNGELFDGANYASVGRTLINADGSTGLLLLGRPVWEVPSAPTDVSVDDTQILAFCDPQRFIVVDRVGMSIEPIPHIFGAAQGNLVTGQRGLYFYYRNTAKPINVDAGRLLFVKNA